MKRTRPLQVSRTHAGNQLAGRKAADEAMENAAKVQYTAAWQWVYQPAINQMPARGTPAYVSCLSVSALRMAEKARKAGGTKEEVERLKGAAMQWRRALMYPMLIQTVGKDSPEYTDAPEGSTLQSATEIVSIPDLSQPFYQGGLIMSSISKGTRVLGLYPTVKQT